jgi:chromosome segregation protein
MLEKKLSELRVKNRNIADKRDLLYRTYTKMESEYNSVREHHAKLIAFLWDEYELTYTEATKRATQKITAENRAEAVSAQTKYKNQIRALGSVNVGAIEEYKEVKKQFDELQAQIEDLKKSKESLVSIIASLEETMCNDFKATLEEINVNFGKVFSELFGGGRAELNLTDPNNVLESGIDINVAPPGKVIKNMSLLSGGEQAFVAIALYFAILKVNPSPFCILDEIEAALDEVNVDKFADYVKKYSDKTQFVIITHRRGTMEAAERLYGVTMHEKGISDVLSIDVSEIEQKIGMELH